VLRALFQKAPTEGAGCTPTLLKGPRVARHSSGWSALHKQLRGETGLRILDIGPTSPTNINFLTGMGQSVYMSDLVPESHNPAWVRMPAGDIAAPEFDVASFLAQNLAFDGRQFDVVLLWTTLGYLPEILVGAVVERLHASMTPGGKVLAMFHGKANGENTAYCRYHLTDSDSIEMQTSTPVPLQRVYSNRSIEKTFGGYSDCKFFLAKDNLYEAIITR
jgi:hypothetical protein